MLAVRPNVRVCKKGAVALASVIVQLRRGLQNLRVVLALGDHPTRTCRLGQGTHFLGTRIHPSSRLHQTACGNDEFRRGSHNVRQA
jgi:hypothetical protein